MSSRQPSDHDRNSSAAHEQIPTRSIPPPPSMHSAAAITLTNRCRFHANELPKNVPKLCGVDHPTLQNRLISEHNLGVGVHQPHPGDQYYSWSNLGWFSSQISECLNSKQNLFPKYRHTPSYHHPSRSHCKSKVTMPNDTCMHRKGMLGDRPVASCHRLGTTSMQHHCQLFRAAPCVWMSLQAVQLTRGIGDRRRRGRGFGEILIRSAAGSVRSRKFGAGRCIRFRHGQF